MIFCIRSLNWANIAEGVPTLKQHLSLPGGVSVGGINMLFIQLKAAPWDDINFRF